MVSLLGGLIWIYVLYVQCWQASLDIIWISTLGFVDSIIFSIYKRIIGFTYVLCVCVCVYIYKTEVKKAKSFLLTLMLVYLLFIFMYYFSHV